MARHDELAALKARLRLSQFIGKRIKLERRGGDWFGLCPFHEEKTGSFSVSDRKGFYKCFGCGAHGDLLDWWQKIEGLTLAAAIERLKQEAGSASAWRETERPAKADDREAREKRDQAMQIWREASPIGGTIAETYLRKARCIGIALPDTLRFHEGLPIAGPMSDLWPAMVAAVRDAKHDLLAIQRTFLARDGSGKALIQSPKRSLGSLGSGAVQLAPAAMTLGIAEGIETGLSAMELFAVPVWCALGSNLARIELPSVVRNIVIFADHGTAGEEAAAKAALAFRDIGRKVAVRFSTVGKDFNDELKARRNGK